MILYAGHSVVASIIEISFLQSCFSKFTFEESGTSGEGKGLPCLIKRLEIGRWCVKVEYNLDVDFDFQRHGLRFMNYRVFHQLGDLG